MLGIFIAQGFFTSNGGFQGFRGKFIFVDLGFNREIHENRVSAKKSCFTVYVIFSDFLTGIDFLQIIHNPEVINVLEIYFGQVNMLANFH